MQFKHLRMTTLNNSLALISHIIPYLDDLQTYTYQKYVLDICFKANKIHLKTVCFLFFWGGQYSFCLFHKYVSLCVCKLFFFPSKISQELLNLGF